MPKVLTTKVGVFMYERKHKRVVLCMRYDVSSMLEIISGIKGQWAVKSLEQSRSVWCILRQKALWVASGNSDGRAEKSEGTRKIRKKKKARRLMKNTRHCDHG